LPWIFSGFLLRAGMLWMKDRSSWRKFDAIGGAAARFLRSYLSHDLFTFLVRCVWYFRLPECAGMKPSHARHEE
jgi:hypothetical protein